MTKRKMAILGFLLVAGAVALLFVRNNARTRLQEKEEALLRQAERIAQLESENARLSNLVVRATNTVTPANDFSGELLRLRGEVGVLRQQTNELGVLRQNNVSLSQAVTEAQTNQLPAEDQLIVRQTHAVDAMTTLLQAIKKYGLSHNGQYPASLDQIISSGDLGATNLLGNHKLSDFEFGEAAGVDTQGKPVILRLRVPIAKPGGGAVMVVGGLDHAGVPNTSTWSVNPERP